MNMLVIDLFFSYIPYVVDGQDKKNARTSPSQFLRHTQSQKKKTALNQSNQMTQNPLFYCILFYYSSTTFGMFTHALLKNRNDPTLFKCQSYIY